MNKKEVKVTRTDPDKDEFSQSGISTYLECPRKFYYYKIEKVKSEQSTAAVFGTAIHAGVEEFYTSRDVLKSINAFTELFIDAPESKKHTLRGGIYIMEKYCAEYRDDPAVLIDNIETEQWFPMPDGSMLLARMDRLIQENGLTLVVDTKSTSMSLTPYYFKKYENDLQGSLYFHIVKSILGECDGVLIDGIKVPYPVRSGEPFVRQMFLRTDEQIENAIETYTKAVGEIRKGNFPCNPNSCANWGGCPYLLKCKHEGKIN